MTERVPEAVLDAYGLGGAVSSMFERGQVSRHWLAGQADAHVVLRRYHAGRTAPAAKWEEQLIRRAEAQGWPVALPLPASNGERLIEHEGRLWSAAPFLEGEHGAEDSPAMHHIYGRLLARLHHDLDSFEVEGQRPDCGKVWELDAWVAPANAGSFNDLLAAFGKEHPELAAGVRRYRYRNLRELSRLHYPDLPDHTVHGDFGPWNMLWRDGQLSGLLDFDWSRRDALACDIAGLVPWHDVPHPLIYRWLPGGPPSGRPGVGFDACVGSRSAAVLGFVPAGGMGLLGGERPAQSIAGTVNTRLPAMDAMEAPLLAMRGR